MVYCNYKITTSAEMAEIVTAFFGQLGFDTFEETAEGVDAFIPQRMVNDELNNEVKALETQFGFAYKVEVIEHQNWNTEWESNFKPVVVENFCAVRASFHEPITDVMYEMVVNPKMAFGTGHHETTYMMMDVMRGLDFEGKTVFDYGCGTGILSILASMLKADFIDAVDIENESYLNTIENLELNNIGNVNTFEGTLETIKGGNYNVILANINRNVILDTLSDLKSKMATNGQLVISGFLLEDEIILRNACEENGLKVIEVKKRNNWLSMLIHN